MTSTQITERINKANEKITKKQGTIAKKQALIQKKENALVKKFNFDLDVIRSKQNSEVYEEYGRETGYEIVSELSSIEWLKDDIARLEKEIPEIRKTVEKYEKQLAGELEKESLLTKEIPEEFTALKNYLVETWDEDDKHRKAYLAKRYNELGYREFYQHHNGADYLLIHTSDADIHKHNVKDAENIIIDLYNRVKEITGQIIEWDVHVTAGNQNLAVLAGTVKGKEGKARVETIEAGGYNIQRLHIRTLVHSI